MIADMLVSKEFYQRYVRLPENTVPPEIANDPKLYPFFKDCRGAIDGSHIDSRMPSEEISASQNWKGGVTQSVLAACTFNMLFCYVLSGWEGSAADGKVFEAAWERDLAIPVGC